MELLDARWNVHHTTNVLTIGVRATVPLLRNLEVLEELQVPKKDREELQKSLVKTATKDAGIIIAKLRRLHTTASTFVFPWHMVELYSLHKVWSP
eukprot:890280-Pyramimonas_sp.AAC.2